MSATQTPQQETPADSRTAATVAQVARRRVLWLVNASHALDHFEKQVLPVLYPVLMAELGFGYVQLGLLGAARAMFLAKDPRPSAAV